MSRTLSEEWMVPHCRGLHNPSLRLCQTTYSPDTPEHSLMAQETLKIVEKFQLQIFHLGPLLEEVTSHCPDCKAVNEPLG